MTATGLSAAFEPLLPFRLPRFVARALGIEELDQMYEELRARDEPLPDQLLEHMNVTCRTAQMDLDRVPRKGPAVVVANHPSGILEGAVLAKMLTGIRPDVRFLANSLLLRIPEIRHLLIAVDPMGGSEANRANRAGLRQAIAHLEQGGMLVVFPAGEVSHFHFRQGRVVDSEWNPAVTRMLDIVSRRGKTPQVTPVFVSGGNSAAFQLLGMIHPRLRTLLLVREFLRKRNQTVEVRIGAPVEAAKLLALESDEERTDYLRWRTYLLESRAPFHAETAKPLKTGRQATLEPIVHAADRKRMAAEVASLGEECRMGGSGDLSVYLASADRIPHVLYEIGRLRELTFRAAGEGTGKATDIDRFDAHYLHLFVWNESKREVAGAYRLVQTDRAPSLYTATLFRYDDAFRRQLGPAIELGRSFIRAEYQRGFAPLLLLWKGIGSFLAQHPQYRILFGPVSISNQYQSLSRELMVSFLERRASLREWMGLVSSRNPFRSRSAQGRFPASGLDIDDLSDVVSDLEPSRAGVPVLLRQYLRLGGKLLAFNVDPEFANALDGLILVDLTRTEPKLLERYLGKGEAARFRAYQKGQNGTL